MKSFGWFYIAQLFFAGNSAGLNRRMKVNLPAGTYCNVITGPATSGGCSGDYVQVDGSGMAQVTIKNNEEPMFAIHVGKWSFKFYVYFYALHQTLIVQKYTRKM